MYFTGGRLREEFDFLDTLAQFIEGGDAALEERASIRCGRYAVAASIEEANAQRCSRSAIVLDTTGCETARSRAALAMLPAPPLQAGDASPAIRTVAQFDPQAACDIP